MCELSVSIHASLLPPNHRSYLSGIFSKLFNYTLLFRNIVGYRTLSEKKSRCTRSSLVGKRAEKGTHYQLWQKFLNQLCAEFVPTVANLSANNALLKPLKGAWYHQD